MPYIEQFIRESLDSKLAPLLKEELAAGDLAYVITKISLAYLHKPGKVLTFATLAMAVGVLVLTTIEIIRRVVLPYEDKKCRENGDVFNENPN